MWGGAEGVYSFFMLVWQWLYRLTEQGKDIYSFCPVKWTGPIAISSGLTPQISITIQLYLKSVTAVHQQHKHLFILAY